MLAGATALLLLDTPVAGQLVRAGTISAPLVLARAQAGGVRSTAVGADDVTYATFGADTPRFQGSARRLLVGGQRSQGIRNPGFEGVTLGVLGAGGALPANMSSTIAAGHTIELVQTLTQAGLPCIDFEFVAGAAGTSLLYFEASNGVALAPSAPYTSSVFLQLLNLVGGGNISNLFTRTRVDNTTGTNVNSASITGISTVALQRVLTSYTTPADAVAGRLGVLISTSGGGVTVRLRAAAPQMEAGSFASTPILPAVGSPAASTRGADLVSAALTSLGIPASGACTLLWRGLVGQNAPSGIDQALCQVDAGSDTGRFWLRNAAGGSTVLAGHSVGGVPTSTPSLGSVTASGLFSVGITIDGAGRIAGCVDGGTVQAVTGGPSSGLTTLRLGNNAANTAALFGEVATFRAVTRAMSDAELQAAVAGLT